MSGKLGVRPAFSPERIKRFHKDAKHAGDDHWWTWHKPPEATRAIAIMIYHPNVGAECSMRVLIGDSGDRFTGPSTPKATCQKCGDTGALVAGKWFPE